MIKQIAIQGFKSFRQVDLSLGGLNLFIGTNASGKSNFLEVLRFLQGLAYGFSVFEVLDGKPKSATANDWPGIRGGSSSAAFTARGKGKRTNQRESISIQTRLQGEKEIDFTHALEFSPREGRVLSESLSEDELRVFRTAKHRWDKGELIVECFRGRQWVKVVGKRWPPKFHFADDRSVLRAIEMSSFQMPSEAQEAAAQCCQMYRDIFQFNPRPEVLRGYSQVPTARSMGPSGENFAALMAEIARQSQTLDEYESWLRELSPIELDRVKVLPGAADDVMFALQERGQLYPAKILSDGTLRFAALTAVFFQRDMPRVLLIEEIENGIHPSRLRLLLELLKQRTRSGRVQVFATSHSPVVLSWLRNEDYATTFVCRRNPKSGESDIRPVASLPNFEKLAARHEIDELFVEGGMEAML
jgi:predicted ATPase